MSKYRQAKPTSKNKKDLAFERMIEECVKKILDSIGVYSMEKNIFYSWGKR